MTSDSSHAKGFFTQGALIPVLEGCPDRTVTLMVTLYFLFCDILLNKEKPKNNKLKGGMLPHIVAKLDVVRPINRFSQACTQRQGQQSY